MKVPIRRSRGGDSVGLRLGLRVKDVPTAMRFYGGLGFEEEGVVPDQDGVPLLAILKQGAVFSCLDPFGYEWEFSVPIPGAEPDDATGAVQENWFGSTR